MSFQHKSFWISRDAGCLTEENMGYESSTRMEPKRGHQWFMDTGEPEIFINNKKQAIEAVNGRPVSGVSHLNVSPWDTTSGFQSVPVQFTDRLFGSESVPTVNLVDRSILSVGSGNLSMGRNFFENQYGNNPSVGLSMSHTIEDHSSCLGFSGIRKVKVNQVRDSDSVMPTSAGHSYSRADNSSISVGAGYNKNDDNSISLGPTYNNEDNLISLGPTYSNENENTISIGTTFSKADGNLVSLGHTYSKGDKNFMLMGHNYGKGDDSILSMGQPFDKGDGNFISMGQSFEKEDSNIISMGTSYNKGHENFISMGATYSKAGDNFITIATSYDKRDDHIISMGATYDKADSNIVSAGPSYDKGDSSSLSMDHNYNKVESSTISFGGFHNEPNSNPSGGVISGYNLLMDNQNMTQTCESQKDPTVSNSDQVVNGTRIANGKNETTVKNKELKTAKKVPSNNFPSNVKSLLSTGMFDGVPVKYVSWSREKNLKGVIKGTGYLCSCNDCKHSKALNAYEFERHAGAKTKHPNNHIYFENGKTIYAVVQELKNTPQEMLFDAIQNVTGCPIKQKNFRIWKASYQAATRELQRIYGKDEVTF
ncbi:putative DNA-binding protein [Quillaja saponaria]|uniref:DNA-binding protein n=1 Tax=Quillaja saponaria TaxID=32244 RepID=A0AAD7VHB4_QUISA|nr:putative DNA-binding protein [Quillaja saponaria]